MIPSLLEGRKKLAVIGLGYVGLPIALAFAKKMKVIGFDVKPDRINLMKKGIDPLVQQMAFPNIPVDIGRGWKDQKEQMGDQGEAHNETDLLVPCP